MDRGAGRLWEIWRQQERERDKKEKVSAWEGYKKVRKWDRES